MNSHKRKFDDMDKAIDGLASVEEVLEAFDEMDNARQKSESEVEDSKKAVTAVAAPAPAAGAPEAAPLATAPPPPPSASATDLSRAAAPKPQASHKKRKLRSYFSQPNADLYSRKLAIENDGGMVIYSRKNEEVSQLAQFLEQEWKNFHKGNAKAQTAMSFVIGEEDGYLGITICANGCESYDKSLTERIRLNAKAFRSLEWRSFKQAKANVLILSAALKHFPVIETYAPEDQKSVSYSTASICAALDSTPSPTAPLADKMPNAAAAISPVPPPIPERAPEPTAPTTSYKK